MGGLAAKGAIGALRSSLPQRNAIGRGNAIFILLRERQSLMKDS